MTKLVVLMIAVGILFFESNTYAQIRRLDQSASKKSSSHIKPVLKGKTNEFEALKKLQEGHKRIEEILQRRSSIPIIWEGHSKIQTGKTFRGIVLNSIVSTNISSPVLVEALPNQGLPYRAKFACEAQTQNKRVFTVCNKMITRDLEIPVVVQILNVDGTSGLLGDYDEGSEEVITGNVLSHSSQGLLSGIGSSINGGNVSASLLQGLVESGNSTSELLLNDMKTKEPIVSIDSGAEVLIYFMEAINEI